MNLPRFAVEHQTFINFLTALVFIGGVYSYFNLGQLEDPDFTVKIGAIITTYPGASPEEVELEVTDRIETAIQEMPQIRYLTSYSKAGISIIKVEMQQEYWADRLPQVWDEMRKKIRDITPHFPPGVGKPDIVDDFSFVFGFVLAVTGDGYTYAELESYAKGIRKELNLVPGVARADLWGVQPKVIYLDVSENQLAELKITQEDIIATLAAQNMVVDAGAIETQDRRMRIEATGMFSRPEDIGELVIRRSGLDTLTNTVRELAPYARDMESSFPVGGARSGSRADVIASELIRINDVATVRQGYLDPPFQMMRFNGEPALAIQVANATGGNIVVTGQALDQRLEEILPLLPAGIEVERFVWQSDLVKESIGAFVINLMEAVLIVLIVVALAMGWRNGLIIGWALVLTISGTFIVMYAMEIQLHRVSLGALVIALGMMVDNAIVVADNAAVGMARGQEREDACVDAANKPSMALIGATVVAAMAFFPIYFAEADSGEYARTLFIVVFVSLIWSWLIAMLVTPLNCIWFLEGPAEEADEDSDPLDTPFFRIYKRTLEGLIRNRFVTILAAGVVLLAAIIGFGGIPQQFFPDSTRTQLRVDYWAPQGTPIRSVSETARRIEEKIAGDPRIRNVGTFIGSGGPRFYLPVDPEFPYAEYVQIIINTNTFADVDPLYEELEPWLNENFPEGLTRVRKYTVGPGDEWPFELRISGPAEADMATLRSLAEEGMAILNDTPLARHVRTDIRQRVPKVVTEYNQQRARWSGVSRHDMAMATQRAYDGTPVGLYREGDSLYPIIVRDIDEQRARAAAELDIVQVQPALGLKTLPLSQITSDISVQWEDPIIVRHQRRRQAAIQASPNGTTFPAMRAAVMEKFDELEASLPAGYSFFWDGELESTQTAQLSLIPGLVPAVVIMAIIMVALFNSVLPPLVIVLTIPFAVIGVTAILLPTQTAFGFMALLGGMSLAGLMIKNAIVLMDEIDANKALGKSPYDSVIDAGLSRVRPICVGAATTILGVIPLLTDAFWVSMAMTMMAGLTFGTALTCLLLPTFYATLYRIPAPAKQ